MVDEHKVAGNPDERGRGDILLSARMRVHAEDAGFLVRIRNVSAGGLMAELPHPLPPDSMVEIKLDGLGWVAGRVVWQTEGRSGIAFDQPIDVAIVYEAGNAGR
ncbi:MAG: PilZ domain-containing protein [Sphingomonas phyllosphaerae]